MRIAAIAGIVSLSMLIWLFATSHGTLDARGRPLGTDVEWDGSPAGDPEPDIGERGLQQRLGRGAIGQEEHAERKLLGICGDARFAGQRPEEPARQRHRDSGPVAGLRIGRQSAAVGERGQRIERRVDRFVRGARRRRSRARAS